MKDELAFIYVCVCFGNEQIWAGPLTENRVAAVLLNRGPIRYSITAQWDDLGIPPKTLVQARDLWQVFISRENLLFDF